MIDVGINRGADGKLCGDVDFAAAQRARVVDHAGAGRRRADDDRDAAREHAARGRVAGRRGLATPDSGAARSARHAFEQRPQCRRARGGGQQVLECVAGDHAAGRVPDCAIRRPRRPSRGHTTRSPMPRETDRCLARHEEKERAARRCRRTAARRTSARSARRFPVHDACDADGTSRARLRVVRRCRRRVAPARSPSTPANTSVIGRRSQKSDAFDRVEVIPRRARRCADDTERDAPHAGFRSPARSAAVDGTRSRTTPTHADQREREVGQHVCRVRDAEPRRWSANPWYVGSCAMPGTNAHAAATSSVNAPTRSAATVGALSDAYGERRCQAFGRVNVWMP